ncbi:MAG: hypothetical protein HZA91_03165 [Verrucomicrobia bacterium]|nr:hypothetical protein [Verrucomicrobiota bacterium]
MRITHYALRITPALAVVALLTPASLRADLPPVRGERAVFAISEDVVVAQPARFGANLQPPAMSHWSEEPFHNQWWLHPNLNPLEARVKNLATGGGADFIECLTRWQGSQGSGMGWYDVFRDGFFDGGNVTVYRHGGGKTALVREGRIKSYKASREGVNRLWFDKPGPEVKAGDEFIIRITRGDVPAGATRTMEGRPFIMRGFMIFDRQREQQFADAGGKMVVDSDAPPGGGRGSLRVSVPAGATPVGIGTWLISAEKSDWPRFKEGKSYELRFWARQQGMATGAVRVRVASLKEAAVTVGREWKEHVVEFIGAPPKRAAEPLEFGIGEAGTLWLDNVVIFEKGVAPWAFYPEIVETLKDYRPGHLRLWALQCNRGFGRSLDSALGPVLESDTEFGELSGGAPTNATGLHQQLEFCAAIGTRPWIIVSTLATLEEHRQLIEYLAGPADSPFGKKRAAWGRRAPWTDSFDTIYIETGNETWNGMFGPQCFSGRPEDYGSYSELIFQTMKTSPHFQPARFKFILNGWVAVTNRKWGYGPLALSTCPSADASDIAYYTGGWDAVGLIKAEDERSGWFNVLTYSCRMLRPRSLEYAQVMKEISAERGRPVSPMVYEAGPGYTLPGPGKFNRKEQDEGKSMAQAVNSLDIFMTNLAAGYAEQSFFLFRNGHYWSSHNRQWQEHIAWKALKLRNRLLEGDLITATAREMVLVDLPEAEAVVLSQSNSADRRARKFPAVSDVPLVACYPFKQGNRYAIMLYSRRLDAPTPVTLELPYAPAPEVEIHTLAAKPDTHNVDDELVKVKVETRNDFARKYQLTLPPCGVMVLVNKAR